jgi:3-hydroxyacyl-CoA dehydrogenase
MNRDRLLADAKAQALAMVEGYTPPAPPSFHLPGPSGRTALALAAHGFHRRGLATDYDLIVSDALATVLTGGETDPLDALDEGALLALEREQLMRRIRDPRTMARIETMLETGKPLRN